MKKECKVLKHGKNGLAVIIPQLYKDLLNINAGDIIDLNLEIKDIEKKEIILKVTNKKIKNKE